MTNKQTIVNKPAPASLKKMLEEKKEWAKQIRTGDIKAPSIDSARRIA